MASSGGPGRAGGRRPGQDGCALPGPVHHDIRQPDAGLGDARAYFDGRYDLPLHAMLQEPGEEQALDEAVIPGAHRFLLQVTVEELDIGPIARAEVLFDGSEWDLRGHVHSV